MTILGASFIGSEMRKFVWGSLEHEAGKASAMIQAIAWVVGAEDSAFGKTLEYVTLRMQLYVRQELEKEHANRS